MTPQLSLVCIVNNTEIYNSFLDSLKTQVGIQYELLPIMNLGNEFTSARQAYNSVIASLKGRYVIFLHPDIRFLNERVLLKISEAANVICDFGVIGVAGARGNSYHQAEIVTSIVHGIDRHSFGKSLNCPVEVQTVDECLFLVERNYLIGHQFCNRSGWHLYAVEYCLNCIKDGRKNYVVPADIWHMSEGKSLDEKYVEQVESIVKDWNPYFDYIYSTIKTWKTKGITANFYRKYYWLKQRVKRQIIRRG